jgi:hypothetical protein
MKLLFRKAPLYTYIMQNRVYFVFVLLVLFFLPQAVKADKVKKMGLYILCHRQDADKDDNFFNRYLGTLIQDYLKEKLADKRIEVTFLNKYVPKHKIFDKFDESFYINEGKIDTMGKDLGCQRTLILYFGYSKKLQKAEEIYTYDRIQFYGTMSYTGPSKGKDYKNLNFKRYLKGKGYGMGPVSQANLEYFKEFILEAVNSVKIDNK